MATDAALTGSNLRGTTSDRMAWRRNARCEARSIGASSPVADPTPEPGRSASVVDSVWTVRDCAALLAASGGAPLVGTTAGTWPCGEGRWCCSVPGGCLLLRTCADLAPRAGCPHRRDGAAKCLSSGVARGNPNSSLLLPEPGSGRTANTEPPANAQEDVENRATARPVTAHGAVWHCSRCSRPSCAIVRGSHPLHLVSNADVPQPARLVEPGSKLGLSPTTNTQKNSRSLSTERLVRRSACCSRSNESRIG